MYQHGGGRYQLHEHRALIIGVNHVAGKYNPGGGVNDLLTYGASIAAASGCTAFKGFATGTPAVDYPGQTFSGSPTDLASLIQTTAWQTVIGLFDTIVLNAFTYTNGRDNRWTVDITNDHLEAEYNEVKELADYWLANQPGKTLVIQNWEGDWSLLGGFNEYTSVPQNRPARMAAFLRVRQEAVEAARKGSGSSATVMHGVEVNRVLDGFGARVHRDVLDTIRPDMVSLSLYEAINTWGTGQADANASIDALVPKVRDKIRMATRDRCPIYVGEGAWPEADPSFTSLSLNAGTMMTRTLDLCESLGMWGFFPWNLFDNEELSPGVPRGYYMVKPDGALSDQGVVVAARW